MISARVGLISGKTLLLDAGLDEEVESLKRRARQVLGLGAGKGRLLDSSGGVLDGCASIQEAKLQNGDSLTLHISRVQVVGNASAFAANS